MAEEDDGEEGKEDRQRSLKESAILFGRDVALAFLVVALVLGAIFVYTQVWPPIVIVEGDSMQHSDDTSFIGVVDTGDLVLVQAVRQHVDVVTYVEGRVTGYKTYSDFGDVIIFHRPGSALPATPIIHRAIVYVLPNASGGVDVPSLARLPADEWYAEAGGNPVAVPYGITRFTIRNAGGFLEDQALPFNVSGVDSEGFLTKGDHNPSRDPWGPVPVSRILGKARGELPWFGLVKLIVDPERGCCPNGWGDPRAPRNSWDALLVSLVLIVVGTFAADFGWSYWKKWRRRMKVKGGETREDSEADATNRGSEPPLEPKPVEATSQEPTSEGDASPGPLEEPPVTDDSRRDSA